MRFALIFCLMFTSTAIAQDAKKIKPSFDAKAKALAYLKENTNDPAKFSLVKAGSPFNPRGWLVVDYAGHPKYLVPETVAITIKHREANPLGALHLREVVVFFDQAGEVKRVLPSDEVRPFNGTDPFMKSFLDQFP